MALKNKRTNKTQKTQVSFLPQAWLRPFSLLDSALLVSLQITLTLSPILWQGDRSYITFCLHVLVFLTGFLLLLCAFCRRVHSLSWCCWSQALLGSLGVLLKPSILPSTSSFLLAAFNQSVSFLWAWCRDLRLSNTGRQQEFNSAGSGRCIYCDAQHHMGAGLQTGAGCKLINICKKALG